MVNFKKYFPRQQQEKFLVKILFAILFITLTLVTFFFTLIYQNLKIHSLEQAYKDELENIISISYSATVMNDTADALLKQLYENPKINQLVYTNTPNSFNIINSISYFNEYIAASHWVDSAYIYCRKENTIVFSFFSDNKYNFGRTQLESFWDIDYLNYLCGLYPPLNSPILRETTTNDSSESQKVFTYYHPVKNHSNYYDGMYVVNISANRLIELCQGIANNTSRQIVIADNNKNYYASTTQLLDQAHLNTLLTQISETNETCGYCTIDSADNKIFCTWNKKNSSQFTFISCISETDVLLQANHLKSILFFFYSAVLIISCCAIIVLSYLTNTAYDKLQKQYENTEKKYRLNHGLVKDTLLRNFLSAKGDLASIIENFQDYNILLQSYTNYSLILMEINENPRENTTRLLHPNARTIFKNSLDHILSNQFRFELVDVLQNRLLLILECPDSAVISELSHKLSVKLMETNEQSISGIFAVDVGIFSDVPSSYKQLTAHMDLLYFYPAGKFVSLDDLNQRSFYGYQQLKTVTNKFIYHMNEQRFDEASSVLSEFFDEWFEPSSDARLTLDYLIKELTLYLESFFYKYAVNTNFDMNIFQNTIMRCECSGDVKNQFLHLIDDIQSVFSVIGQRNKYIDDVIDRIQRNYQDPNLSADTLADEIGLSSSHIQSVFKSSTGISIARYMRQLRLAKSTELLIQTDISINDIAALTGFGNANYFYAAFKKHYSMTPNEYRIQYKTHVSAPADTENKLSAEKEKEQPPQE